MKSTWIPYLQHKTRAICKALRLLGPLQIWVFTSLIILGLLFYYFIIVGYRSSGETLSREQFEKRLAAVLNYLYPPYKAYELSSEGLVNSDTDPIIQELASRYGPKLLDWGKLLETSQGEGQQDRNPLNDHFFEGIHQKWRGSLWIRGFHRKTVQGGFETGF